ncbi:MAG: sulfite exporter TauE/SafE family protein [Campylobacterales bacterium]|nr:sulfite exporter TauE/SafE family protein [Campylobacterales bacterium]
MLELLLLGTAVGTLSGFFGIGGGTILVPLLLLLGFDIKTAIGISVIQMVFSSIFGSYLNQKKGTLDVNMVLFIGLGGFLGGLLSGYVASVFNALTLEIIFLLFALFALSRVFIKTQEHAEHKQLSRLLLFFIGFPLGIFSMTIGVGGSIILVPILVGFLHVPLKKATSAGLFFVVFSSVSGFISHYINGVMDLSSGVYIGLASLVGVYIGIRLKDAVSVQLQRKLLVGFYLLVVLYLAKRVFF